ncbi:MAG TPA: PEPxxWA-CTERM sorting domain-containing protein [Phenylobacterium sp.]
MLRKLLLGAIAATAAMGLASTASAAQVLVSNVWVYDWDTVAVAGHGNEVSTGIVFNNSDLVFCVDLEHNIYVTTYNPPLVFTTGLLTVDGAGNTLTESDSNRIGQLADLGQFYRNTGAANLIYRLEGVQAAIWSIEYHTTATSGISAVNGYISQFLNVQDNGRGYAHALIAHGPNETGVQNMVTGGVPEPASWALMIGGFGLAGAALRRRRAALA